MPSTAGSATLLPMAEYDRTRWNQRYEAGAGPSGRQAAAWLTGHSAWIDALAAALTAQGRQPTALDIACGAGAVSIWLAQRGWQATGVDISDAALARARAAAAAAGAAAGCTFVRADLDTWRPAPGSVDLLTGFFFLDRRLWPVLRVAVRGGGLLIYQTYNLGRLQTRPGAPAAYLLDPGELAATVRGWGWEILDEQNRSAMDAIVARQKEG